MKHYSPRVYSDSQTNIAKQEASKGETVTVDKELKLNIRTYHAKVRHMKKILCNNMTNQG